MEPNARRRASNLYAGNSIRRPRLCVPLGGFGVRTNRCAAQTRRIEDEASLETCTGDLSAPSRAAVFPAEWHRLVASETPASRGPTSVLSHQSAAAVHGMELLNADFEQVHFTNFATYGNIRALRHTHPGATRR